MEASSLSPVHMSMSTAKNGDYISAFLISPLDQPAKSYKYKQSFKLDHTTNSEKFTCNPEAKYSFSVGSSIELQANNIVLRV